MPYTSTSPRRRIDSVYFKTYRYEGGDITSSCEVFYALHEAASAGLWDVTKFLLANGTDVNAEDQEGETPLHRAARSGAMEVAELLLANGAIINARKRNGSTPLHVAVVAEKKTVAELLRQRGGYE